MLNRIFILILFCFVSVSAEEPILAQEVVCGADIVTIGDAWDYINAERSDIAAILQHSDLMKWPQHIAALVAHLRFIERKAAFVSGKPRTLLRGAIAAVAAEQIPTVRLALADDAAALREEWGDIEASLRLVEKQLPDEALIPTTRLAHLLPPNFPILYVHFVSQPELRVGVPAAIIFRLFTYPEKGITPADLIETHGAKIHVLIADPALSDYQHEHAQPTGTPGEWTFTFIPRRPAQYRMWLDTVPLESGREEFPHANLVATDEYLHVPKGARVETLTAENEGLRGVLHFGNGRLRVDELVSAKLTVTTSDGQPVRTLEPYMEAFAHLVGISEDFSTILHIHPHGAPPKPDDRSGPDIEFRLRPTTSGFHKLFAQVCLDGRVHTLAFGFTVEPQE